MSEYKQRIHKNPDLNVEFENIYRILNQILTRLTTNEARINAIQTAVEGHGITVS